MMMMMMMTSTTTRPATPPAKQHNERNKQDKHYKQHKESKHHNKTKQAYLFLSAENSVKAIAITHQKFTIWVWSNFQQTKPLLKLSGVKYFEWFSIRIHYPTWWHDPIELIFWKTEWNQQPVWFCSDLTYWSDPWSKWSPLFRPDLWEVRYRPGRCFELEGAAGCKGARVMCGFLTGKKTASFYTCTDPLIKRWWFRTDQGNQWPCTRKLVLNYCNPRNSAS